MAFNVTKDMRDFVASHEDEPTWDSQFSTSRDGNDQERVRGAKNVYVRVLNERKDQWLQLVLPFDVGE